MGKQKYFHCTNCNEKHERPVGKYCDKVAGGTEKDVMNLQASGSSDGSNGASSMSSVNIMLLNELKSLN